MGLCGLAAWRQMVGAPVMRLLMPAAAADGRGESRRRIHQTHPSDGDGASEDTKSWPTNGENCSVEVTRQNFDEVLPAIRRAVQRCSFLALDCEMTGLSILDRPNIFHQDMDDRYQQLRTSARNFIPIQLGISCFTAIDNRYEAETFNMYLFPRSFKDQRPKFLADASSLSFLVSNGFDANKCIGQGVAFMPISLRDRYLADLETAEQPATLNTSKRQNVEFLAQLHATVTKWLAGREPTLRLPPVKQHLQRIQLQELQKYQYQAKDPPGFYVRTLTSHRSTLHELVRASSSEVKEWEQEDRRNRLAAVHTAAGAAVIMEIIRDSCKPVVAHNPIYDILYLMESFVSPLPESYSDFKRLVQKWVPGGIYDTKLLAVQAKDHSGNTSLAALYQRWREPEAAQKADRMAALAQGGHLQPLVRHAEGYTRYSGEGEQEGFNHEAGFDAFMTGAVFAHMLNSSKKADTKGAGDRPCGDLRKQRGRISAGWSPYPYINLWGDDQVPELSGTMVLKGVEQSSYSRTRLGKLCKDAIGSFPLQVEYVPSTQTAYLTVRGTITSKVSDLLASRLQAEAGSAGLKWRCHTMAQHRLERAEAGGLEGSVLSLGESNNNQAEPG